MSKELEALEKIKDSFGCDMSYYGLSLEYETIKQALTTKTKKELLFDMLLNYIIDYGDSICIDFIVGEYNNIELYNILKELINTERGD